ncbi:hypothetical protein [Marinactinospora rubrisoli]|uniref:Uncharacterized protein n=1 Tax=Marinactinospora rubrisoli TaxID=2715399 RepID=A0ABW2KPB9_9ACTN
MKRLPAVLAALVMSTGLLMTPTAASADDMQAAACTTWRDSRTFGASCTSGTYRAWADCTNGRRVYGATASNGSWSYAYCASVGSNLSRGGYSYV